MQLAWNKKPHHSWEVGQKAHAVCRSALILLGLTVTYLMVLLQAKFKPGHFV